MHEGDRRRYYSAHIELSDEELARLREGVKIVPGMEAQVMIRTGQRTALEFLVQPLADSIHRAWREE